MRARSFSIAVAGLALAGCATVGPDYDRAAVTAVPNQPDRWQAPLPHAGSTVALADWWRQFDDPLLVDLVEAAQKESANVATAASRIAQARATVTTANAALFPTLDGTASATRGPIVFGNPPILRTQSQAQLQAAWEIDLCGGGLR